MADDEEEISAPPPASAAQLESATSAPAASLPASAPPPDMISPEERADVQKRLIDIKQRQMAAASSGADATVQRLRADRAEIDRTYAASRPSPDLLQPWDQKAKQNEHRTDPVDAFGSIGSIFAMLVPAFVGLPLADSLNAGAAAINAVHASDQQAYDRDYKAWKDNADLAIKRHDIMRQSYNDSILKMNTDLNAGRTEMELTARKYNDQQTLALLESGLDPELNKLFDSRNKAALELASARDQWELQHEKTQDLLRDPQYAVAKSTGDKATMARIIKEHQERWAPGGARSVSYDAEREMMQRWEKENPKATAEEYGAQAVRVRKILAEAEATENGTGKLTGPQADRQELEKRQKEIMQANPEMSEMAALDQARQDMNRSKSFPSGNQISRMRGDLNQINHAIKLAEDNLAFLQKFKAGAGVMGQIMRGGEIAGNITGAGNTTDRVQFRRRVKELQELAPRILTDAAGRPLASVQGKVDEVVAGLNAGDTGPNTIRAYRELLETFKQFGENKRLRIEQPYSNDEAPLVPKVGGGSAETKPAPETKKRPWENDPIVGSVR